MKSKNLEGEAFMRKQVLESMILYVEDFGGGKFWDVTLGISSRGGGQRSQLLKIKRTKKQEAW